MSREGRRKAGTGESIPNYALSMSSPATIGLSGKKQRRDALLAKEVWGRPGLAHERRFLRAVAKVIEPFPDYPNLALPSPDEEGDVPNGAAFVQVTEYILVPIPPAVLTSGFCCDDGVDVTSGSASATQPAGHRTAQRQQGSVAMVSLGWRVGYWRLGVIIVTALPAPPFVAV